MVKEEAEYLKYIYKIVNDPKYEFMETVYKRFFKISPESRFKFGDRSIQEIVMLKANEVILDFNRYKLNEIKMARMKKAHDKALVTAREFHLFKLAYMDYAIECIEKDFNHVIKSNELPVIHFILTEKIESLRKYVVKTTKEISNFNRFMIGDPNSLGII